MNSVFYIGSDEGKYALVIPHIQYLKQKDNRIEVVYNSLSSNPAFDITFPNSKEALDKWVKICKQIEDYYNAMMPQNLGCSCEDNADELMISREHENREYETVSRLANFIKMLFDLIQEDWQYKPKNLEEKMDCVKFWVRNKAKEGK